ncbi:MAG: nicotinate-nucleotide adenylyltransferase [Bacteroidales bacterium]|jgi:nicotinate-nucleotide adenylyltransferase|nr:nicotinate-nucleotide adenylyltransferase [Bacteroidales bacterium]
MIETALFFGSFNPLHVGHLMVANYIAEYETVDEIWFVLSPHNPLKQSSDLLDDTLRLDMLKLGLAGFPTFKISDIELTLPKPSYTIHTLNTLQNQHPERNFILLVGADNWLNFHLWKDSEQIISHYPLWIYPRPSYDLPCEQNLPPRVRIIHSPTFEISSTAIRQAFAQGKNLKAFLPAAVYDFIREKNLYRLN